jgi:hypothetical protein
MGEASSTAENDSRLKLPMENELRDSAARELVEHLRESVAAKITLPVVIEDEAYEVIVQHNPLSFVV